MPKKGKKGRRKPRKARKVDLEKSARRVVDAYLRATGEVQKEVEHVLFDD